MTAGAKTPLQAVVSVICEALADLPPDDQSRALEAVRITLGLGSPGAQATWEPAPAQEDPTPRPMYEPSDPEPEPDPGPRLLWDPSMFEEPVRRTLPTVVVQMMGDRPMVVGQQVGRPGSALVIVGPQRDQRRQLSAPRPPVDAPSAQLSGGSRRGYVRSIR